MTTLRTAAQQALEALEFSTLDAFMLAPISPGRESTIKAITALRAALAEPTIAKNATTQQQLDNKPPSDYRRGYWDGFAIGKREGRIEAEAALAEPDDEPTYCPTCGEEDGGTTCGMPDCGLRCGAEPVQEPVADKMKEAHDWQYRMAGERLRRIEKLEAQRDALLEALKEMLEVWEEDPAYGHASAEKAIAAIKAAEEGA